MSVLVFLIPVSVFLGGLGLFAFVWSLRAGQFGDPKGDALRILQNDNDKRPKD